MKWSKEKIIADLQKLVGDKAKVTADKYAQGEWYTREIHIKPKGEDGISIAGFNDEDIYYSDVDNPEEDVPMVEVRNFHSDSDGGLEKGASKKIRELYFIAVDYFEKEEIVVVDCLKDYF